MTSSLPSGTVTFLFTDIEGSMKLARSHAAAWEDLRAQHDSLLRSAIESNHGVVFQVIGDAFCAAFRNAVDGVAAALDAQRALHRMADSGSPTPVVPRVRMGLHTGAAEVRDGAYQGYLTLAHVQRLMSVARGGQILLSGTTAQLAQADTQLSGGPSIQMRDLGEVRLKDMTAAEHVYQLVAPDLPADFPPLQAFTAVPNNLPNQLTSFIGRERELAELRRLLPTTRLLTLTGSGGVGKTRLSLQVACNTLSEYSDGVWFVELAPLADPSLIPQAIASAIGLREQPGQPLTDLLGAYLHSRTALLLIDNCEHVIADAALLIDRLLHASPQLKVLASSREALGIAGELAWRVPSLEIPNPKSQMPIAEAQQFSAIRLFVERASFAQAGFRLTEANAAAVGQICQRLDGIPLAIELAAARVKAMPVQAIAARLDDRFRLLTGGSRTALPRQQTLRAAIDWSHNLLPEAERVLLRRLSVFAGGWTLEAAEEVASGQTAEEGDRGKLGEIGGNKERQMPLAVVRPPSDVQPSTFNLQPSDVLDLLTRLVEKSLVILDESANGMGRYRLLETVRQYAREKLSDSEEGEAIRDAHLDFYMRLAEEAERKIQGREQVEWLQRLNIELDNLRAAIEWSLQREDTTPGLRLASALHLYWYSQGHAMEGYTRLLDLLARPGGMVPTRARARALSAAAPLGISVPSLSREQRLAWAEEVMQIGREHDDAFLIARALVLMGIPEFDRDYRRGSELLAQAIALWEAQGEGWWLAQTLNGLGSFALLYGHLAEAREVFARAATILRGIGDKNLLSVSIRRLAQVQLSMGDASVTALCAESLQLNREIADVLGMLSSLAVFADLFVARGEFERAARLCAAIAALKESYQFVLILSDEAAQTHATEGARAQMDPAVFEAARVEGSALTWEQAIALALSARDNSPDAPVAIASEAKQSREQS